MQIKIHAWSKMLKERIGRHRMKIGALEAGGTKMVCAIGTDRGEILDRIEIKTETPEITMAKIIDYFRQFDIAALGVGCFGPIDIHKESETYGYITATTKLAWVNYNIVGTLEEALGVKVGFDTDVNGSALGEATWGITQGIQNSMYITIGTGIGAGVISEGRLLHGMLHPETGHIQMKQHPKDIFTGWCPYHGTCFEGMAAGPAIEKRWGKKAVELSDTMEVWEMEAYYIAQALVSYTMILSPERIVLGGGVMKQTQLLPLVHAEFKRQMAGYIQTKEIAKIEDFIVLASLQDDQGILGAVQLGVEALAV